MATDSHHAFSESAREAPSASYERAGDLVGALFGAAGTRNLSDAQRAARAWFAANGDRERLHTTGVWLRKSGRKGTDPIMVVRLDSNLLAQELATNKDLYLARIAREGVRISDLRLTVGAASKVRKVPSVSPTARKEEPPPLPELSARERAEIGKATEGLPEKLRESVSRAMCATMARAKQRGAHEM